MQARSLPEFLKDNNYPLREYIVVNREERYFVAVLFSILLSEKSVLHNFVEWLLGKGLISSFQVDAAKLEAFFEYTYLRDTWDCLKDDDLKKSYIIEALCMNQESLIPSDRTEFNRYFGSSQSKSENHQSIHSPASWSLKNLSDRKDAINDDLFVRICHFKWSFNIKPDLVIALDKENVICIEAKMESGEDVYGADEMNKFTRRNIPGLKISQSGLQKYMFENLLGYKCNHILLDKCGGKYKLSWHEVFNGDWFRKNELHPYLQRVLKENALLK